ncbi:MAG: Stp1/IreP family PP2C-type Ser/Thr phosphatase [Clostridia bacterium]|nr:Stp1/IreP family PP2C-type Ser/Thr phosphatase [Clostridia bacterium]
MQIYGKSDVGMVRTCNQDAFCVLELPNDAALSILCDGMGGAKAGNIASQIATDTIKDYVTKSYSPQMTSLSIENLLRGAIDTANIEVYDKANSSEDYVGMVTTVVLVLVKDGIAHISHIGDSRAYLITSDSIEQITRDHSIIQDMIDSGQITEQEAKTHPKKNIITRAVGILPQIDSEYNQVELNGGILLSCTDGLSGMLSAEQIKEITLVNKLDEVPDKLIVAANDLQSNDNVTVTVVAE